MPSSESLLLKDFPPVSYEQWRQTVEADLRGVPFEKKLVTRTYEGIELQPLYTAEDWPCEGDPSGFPGMVPTTRGITALGGAMCGWDIRQEHRDADPADTNKAILEDLNGGVTSLQLRLDAGCRYGLDADNPATRRLAGQDGLMLHHVDDWQTLLDGVRLDIAGVGLEAGAGVIGASAQLVALLGRLGVKPEQARGSLNADPLAVLARRGEYPLPLGAAMKQTADLAVWTQDNLPKFTAVRVGSAPYHHAGADAAQDLAFSMATAVEYMRALTAAGLSSEQAAGQLLFSYAVGTNLFLAVAKLRAARRLWAQVAKHCGVPDPTGLACGMKMHVRTSKRVLTQRDPYVNILRGTVCTFAAAIAGAQVITCEPFDKALGLPDTFSRRIARNTQAILAEESHLAKVVDPAGGAWMVESLTDQLCEKAWPIFQAIESGGGMGQALLSGWVNQQIESAYEPRSKNIARRRDAVTGVSEFPNLTEKTVEARRPDTAALIEQARTKLSAQRDKAGEAAKTALQQLQQSVTSGKPGEVTAQAIAAAEAGATLGQISAVVFDGAEPLAIAPLMPHPYAEPFEHLRDVSDEHMQLTGQRPRILLVNLGRVAEHNARTTYSRSFFEAGGIEAVSSEPILGQPDVMAVTASAAFAGSDASMACICSTDAIYQGAVPLVAQALKRAGCGQVVLAGFPGDQEEAYRDAGVDRFIFMKCDVLQILTELLQHAGVLRPEPSPVMA